MRDAMERINLNVPGEVAVPWNLRPLSGDALAPGAVGRLRPDTLRALEESIRLVLGLT